MLFGGAARIDRSPSQKPVSTLSGLERRRASARASARAADGARNRDIELRTPDGVGARLIGEEWQAKESGMQKDREYRQRRRARTRGAAYAEDVNQRRTESLAQRLSRWWRLRQGDGLSRNAYAAMLAGQGGVCATCRRAHADPLVVDRSRVTGEVRGLLCRRCKAALPWFRDDHALLLRAIAYLKNGPLVDKP